MFRQRTMFPDTRIRLTAQAGALAVYTPYSPHFVDDLKARVPASDRKWDGDNKAWLVAAAHGVMVQGLLERHFGAVVDLPDDLDTGSQPTMAILDVRYLGATKRREDGSETAFGWWNGGWNVVVPKSALMTWFGQEERPGEAQTLYAVLGVSQSADQAALKTAWRRLVKQWHPDSCREPDAVSQFRAIQEAYEVLGDERKRAKYDAGLKLEASLGRRHELRHEPATGYRSPLRCGLILAEGRQVLGRFVVTKILQWTDIVDAQGRTLVTSWQSGADHFTEAWI